MEFENFVNKLDGNLSDNQVEALRVKFEKYKEQGIKEAKKGKTIAPEYQIYKDLNVLGSEKLLERKDLVPDLINASLYALAGATVVTSIAGIADEQVSRDLALATTMLGAGGLGYLALDYNADKGKNLKKLLTSAGLGNIVLYNAQQKALKHFAQNEGVKSYLDSQNIEDENELGE